MAPSSITVFTFLAAFFAVGNCLTNNVTITNSTSIALGSECTANFTCSSRIPNSFCQSPFDERLQRYTGFCVCPEGYAPSSDRSRCLFSKVVVGDSCEQDQQCAGYSEGRSLCLANSGICDCKSEYIHTSDLRGCLPIVNTLGKEECQDDVQCQVGKPGKLSYCDKPRGETSGICKCNGNAVEGQDEKYGNTCLRKARRLGHVCKIQAQCTANLKYSFCLDGECVRRAEKSKKNKNKNKNSSDKGTPPSGAPFDVISKKAAAATINLLELLVG